MAFQSLRPYFRFSRLIQKLLLAELMAFQTNASGTFAQVVIWNIQVMIYTFKIYIITGRASKPKGIKYTKNVIYLTRFNMVQFSSQNSLLFTNFTEHKFMFTAVDIKTSGCSILFHNVKIKSNKPANLICYHSKV
jgi:hypothetical protein